MSLAQGQPQHPTLKQAEGSAGVDFTACAECHADKSAAPVVHPALGLGCDTCHKVEQEGDEAEVLLTVEGNELCFTCHDDKHAQPAQLFLHPPVRTGPCTACHDPHSSQAPSLLRRPAEGREAAENLCLGCHTDISSQLHKPTLHAAVDLGCATCHLTHKSEPAGQPEGAFHLTKPPAELCRDCHDTAEASLQAAHLDQPFAGAACNECHNPHGSERPKLLNNFAHLPFAEKQCDTCHEAAAEGKVVLLEGARRDLCLACHGDLQERLDQAKFTHTGLSNQSGCVACHSPHAAANPHQIRRGPVALCLGCHADLAKARVEKAHLHRPAFEQSCLICHQEHTGQRPQRLRADVNDLCLECHGRQNAAQFQRAGKVKLFADTVEVEAAAMSGMPILAIRSGATRGHPFGGHPVAGTISAEPLTCVTCHNPHAANGSPKLLVTETPSPTALCVKCHK